MRMLTCVFAMGMTLMSFVDQANAEESNPCDGITCSGHGQCAVVRGDPACACEEGYVPDERSGLNCLQIDESTISATGSDVSAPEDDSEGTTDDATEFDCHDEVDDDGDGLVDCSDPDCMIDDECQEVDASAETVISSAPLGTPGDGQPQGGDEILQGDQSNGAALIATGSVFLGLGFTSLIAATGLIVYWATNPCEYAYPDGVECHQEAHTAAIALFGVGGALTALGVALLSVGIAHRIRERQRLRRLRHGVSIVPSVLPRANGLALSITGTL